MSSNRYQDLLSATKENMVTLHALDTLNVTRNEIKGKIRSNAQLSDVFDAIGVGVPTEDGENDFSLPF